MFVLEIENENQERLTLTQDEGNYQVIKVEGLTPPDADITTIKVANMDGERFKSSRLEKRELSIEIKINGDIEKNRIKLYDFFDSGKMSKIYYRNGSRNVMIVGYCESFEGDLFELGQTVQVSIVCPSPYWESINMVRADISQALGNFQFPFAISEEGVEFTRFIDGRESPIINRGDGECGVVITMKSTLDLISNPVIYNVRTGEFFKVNIELSKGNTVTINTNVGQKSIYKIVDGVQSNIMGLVAKGSSWFQLKRGVNLFTCNADTGIATLEVVFEFKNLFKGV